jgi:hypothetical protein
LRRSQCRDNRTTGSREQIKFRSRHLTEEEKMTTIPWPPCPEHERFPLIKGFITPASDLPPPPGLSGSIYADVTDPTENNERIRVVETDTPWDLNVKWCVCGPYTDVMYGPWCVQVFIDDIDGVGTTSGQIGRACVEWASGVTIPPAAGNDDTSKRCFEYTFSFGANSVTAGVYNLVVVITFATGTCQNPGPRADDILGYAVIPVLVFYDEDAPFCPPFPDPIQ